MGFLNFVNSYSKLIKSKGGVMDLQLISEVGEGAVL